MPQNSHVLAKDGRTRCWGCGGSQEKERWAWGRAKHSKPLPQILFVAGPGISPKPAHAPPLPDHGQELCSAGRECALPHGLCSARASNTVGTWALFSNAPSWAQPSSPSALPVPYMPGPVLGPTGPGGGLASLQEAAALAKDAQVVWGDGVRPLTHHIPPPSAASSSH